MRLLALHDRAAHLSLLRRGQPLGGLGHRGLCFSARFYGLRQTDLVVLCQQWVLADICQIETNEVLVVALNAFLGQDMPNLPSLWASADDLCRALTFVVQLASLSAHKGCRNIVVGVSRCPCTRKDGALGPQHPLKAPRRIRPHSSRSARISPGAPPPEQELAPPLDLELDPGSDQAKQGAHGCLAHR